MYELNENTLKSIAGGCDTDTEICVPKTVIADVMTNLTTAEKVIFNKEIKNFKINIYV